MSGWTASSHDAGWSQKQDARLRPLTFLAWSWSAKFLIRKGEGIKNAGERGNAMGTLGECWWMVFTQGNPLQQAMSKMQHGSVMDSEDFDALTSRDVEGRSCDVLKS